MKFHIPHMFNLRRVLIGRRGMKSMYIYHNHSRKSSGHVFAHDRVEAKRKVVKIVSDAEFYR